MITVFMKRWFFSFVPGKKNILIVLIALIGAISGILVASRYLILDSFAELEKNEVARNVQRVLSAITDDIETLHQIGEDWASWDDTYQFMGDRNENYIQSNLVDETFLTLNLNQMVFVKPGGQILFSKAMDLASKQTRPVPANLLEFLATHNLLDRSPENGGKWSGILLLSEGPLLVTIQPVRTSQEQGPVAGTLIFGRFLDRSAIGDLQQKTHLSLNLLTFNSPSLPSDVTALLPQLPKDSTPVVRPLDGSMVTGYALIPDILGEPALILRVDQSRDIYRQGRRSVLYFAGVIIFLGFLIFLVVLSVFYRIIRSEERYRKLFARIGEGFAVFQCIDLSTDRIPVLCFHEMNQAFEKMMNLVGKDVRGKDAFPLSLLSEPSWLDRCIDVIRTGEVNHFLVVLKHSQRAYDVLAFCSNANQVATIWADVTEKKRAAEQVQYLVEHDNLTGLYNRTFFEKEAQRADTDQKYPLSIIMGEITGLKSVNEGLGHGEGDVLLIKVADIMERSCRKDDRVARWENDSFIILLPATSREVAQQVCERIQESFRKNVDCLIQVGLVLGSATKNNPQQLLTDLLKTAEGNMYQNKLSGLNFQIHRTRDIF